MPRTLAQSDEWLVLPTTSEDSDVWMEPTVSAVSRELRRQGVGVWSSDRANSAFRERGSSEPPELSDDAVSAWESGSREALGKLAFGESATALAELEEAQAFSRRMLVALNRDPARAQTTLDTCLYLVRARMQSGDEQGAVHQVRECVRNSPSTEPTVHMHPPGVMALYDAARNAGADHSSTLLVEGEPSGCAVRVNGVLVGATPLQFSDLYPGRYRVQVECDPSTPSRVHSVEVATGPISIFVFDRFDRSVRTTPFLHLQSEGPPDAQHLVRDARNVARALSASAVVTIAATNRGVLELRVVAGTELISPLVRVAASADGPTDEAVSRAVVALLAGKCVDLSAAQPVALDCRSGTPISMTMSEEAPSEPRGVRPPAGQFIAGLTLASVGAASLVTGYGLLISRRSAADDWLADPGSLDAHGKWLNLGTGLVVTGSSGSALLVTAMPLLLPYRHKTPWWAWMSGGLGLGFAAASIAEGITADPKPDASCSVNNLNPAPCVDRAKRTDLAVLLGVTAAPLLTMPLVYWLRKSDKRLDAEVLPSVRVDRSGAVLGLEGMF
ncbi:MAG: PEGA domain-containing protein [Polyangiales bacterium]